MTRAIYRRLYGVAAVTPPKSPKAIIWFLAPWKVSKAPSLLAGWHLPVSKAGVLHDIAGHLRFAQKSPQMASSIFASWPMPYSAKMHKKHCKIGSKFVQKKDQRGQMLGHFIQFSAPGSFADNKQIMRMRIILGGF